MKRVQCVPGGHTMCICCVYWCRECGFYICKTHVVSRWHSPGIRCPRGHSVVKPR